ncbi:MAG: rRNA maturation RNase YbeY [Chitinophagaceae bacterium]
MQKQSSSRINFFFLARNISFRRRGKLKDFMAFLIRQEGRSIDMINCIFCSDKYLLEMNRKHLKHDYYTDIITFDLSDSSGKISAEIYISIDRVRENAMTSQTTIAHELYRVIFHGLLHLCGYNDKKKDEISEMRSREDYYLSAYGKF